MGYVAISWVAGCTHVLLLLLLLLLLPPPPPPLLLLLSHRMRDNMAGYQPTVPMGSLTHSITHQLLLLLLLLLLLFPGIVATRQATSRSMGPVVSHSI